MSYFKELKAMHSKSKVQLMTILSILGLFFFVTSCSSDDDALWHPVLEVVNQTNDVSSRALINAVTIVGYDFNSLSLAKGDSQTFLLDNGMPGGYEDININVLLSGVNKRIKVNFKNGETTKVTMKGCISAEGCGGFYLEYEER